jgi:nucleoside-diphosphate kinase
MVLEKTFAIIKPDAVEARNAGKILGRIESEGFRIVALKRHSISRHEAEEFYAEHASKGFFGGLVDYMTSGPVFVAVLERENAVARWRAVMGATDPAKADADTIRKEFGTSIERNAVHGSANPGDAARETVFFFSAAELLRA